MKRLLAVGIASTIALAVSASMAMPSGYVGVKGGYDDINMLKGIDVDKYFVNIHGGYLFPVAPQFMVGPQIGATYYGKMKTHPKASLYSFNLEAVGQYLIDQFYIEGRFGGMLGYVRDSHSSKSSLLFTAGAGAGYYFTSNFGLGVTYDHAFGKRYSDSPQAILNHKFPVTNSYGIELTWRF